jgi:hypothetical protein
MTGISDQVQDKLACEAKALLPRLYGLFNLLKDTTSTSIHLSPNTDLEELIYLCGKIQEQHQLISSSLELSTQADNSGNITRSQTVSFI